MNIERFDTAFFYRVICDIHQSKTLEDFVLHALQHFVVADEISTSRILIRNKILFSDAVTGYTSFELDPDKQIQQTAFDKLPIDLSSTSYISGPKVIATEKDTDGYVSIHGQINSYGFISLHVEEKYLTESFFDHFKNLINVLESNIRNIGAENKYKAEVNHNRRIIKELSISDERYQSVMDNIAEGIVISDLDDNLIFINDKMCELTGYSASEVLGTKAYKTFVPEDYWELFELKSNRRQYGDSEQYEIPHINKDGYTWWASVHASPYCNSAGEIIGNIGAVFDITQRKKSEIQLIESQKKLQLILNSSLDAIITIDENNAVVDWNKNAEQFFGYNIVESASLKIDDLILPERYIIAFIKGKERFMELGEKDFFNRRIEMYGRHRSGRIFPIEINISPIKIEDNYYFSAFIQDITERKNNENALIEAKKVAERARKAERQFLAHMSHEIRTPMNAVIGMAHLLQKSNLDQMQLEYVDALRFSADNLMNIISDILDLSKIEAGELEMEFRPFSIHELFYSLQKTYQFKLQDKNIAVHVNIDKDIIYQLTGDKTRLSQILSNLMGNASKFTETGSIDLNASVLKYEKNIVWLEIQVKDTGIGIAPEHLNKIFESFKQAEISIHSKFGGTGLGLTIVKQLTEMHGGRIHVSSQKDKGTTFTLIIPFQKSDIPTKVSIDQTDLVDESSSAMKGMNILVAEDNLINQKLIETILNQWSCQFTMVDNGIDALEASEQCLYDVILMDINMPKMNGYEATKRIRENNDNMNQQTPIITLTAAALQEERNKMYNLGVNDFVTKPFAPDQLQKTILDCIADKESVDHTVEENVSISNELYNLEYLHKFCSNNIDFVHEMVQIFLSENPQKLEQISKGLDQSDWDLIKNICHQLKSTYGTLGMKKQEQLAKDIEQACKTGEQSENTFRKWISELTKLSKVCYPLLESELELNA